MLLKLLEVPAVGWFCSFCDASFPAASLPMWFRPGLHHLREHGPSGMEDPGRSWQPESHRRSAGKCHETPLHVHVTVPDSCFVPGGFYERRTTPKGTMSMKQESHAVASVNHSEHVATPVPGPCLSVSRGRECRYYALSQNAAGCHQRPRSLASLSLQFAITPTQHSMDLILPPFCSCLPGFLWTPQGCGV